MLHLTGMSHGRQGVLLSAHFKAVGDTNDVVYIKRMSFRIFLEPRKMFLLTLNVRC